MVLPRRCQPVVVRCGMGWLYVLPVLFLVAAVLVNTAWRRLIRFRCDRCRRLQPAANLSERGGWSDWCEECARLVHTA
ncbi:MAG: hypothetical protein OXG30_02415 [bacterium]|nr:hypothetical protein [bacterium]